MEQNTYQICLEESIISYINNLVSGNEKPLCEKLYSFYTEQLADENSFDASTFNYWCFCSACIYGLLLLNNYDKDKLDTIKDSICENLRKANEKGFVDKKEFFEPDYNRYYKISLLKNPFMEDAFSSADSFIESGCCKDELFMFSMFWLCAKFKYFIKPVIQNQLCSFLSYCAVKQFDQDSDFYVEKNISNYLSNLFYLRAKSLLKETDSLLNFEAIIAQDKTNFPLLPTFITHDLLTWVTLETKLNKLDASLLKALRWLFYNVNPDPFNEISETAFALFEGIRKTFEDRLEKLPGIVLLMQHLIHFMTSGDFSNLFFSIHEAKLGFHYFHIFLPDVIRPLSEMDDRLKENPVQIEKMEKDSKLLQMLLFGILLEIVRTYTRIDYEVFSADNDNIQIVPQKIVIEEIPWIPGVPVHEEIYKKEYIANFLYTFIVSDEWCLAEKQAFLLNYLSQVFNFNKSTSALEAELFSAEKVQICPDNLDFYINLIFNLSHYLCNNQIYFIREVNFLKEKKEEIFPPALSEYDFRKKYGDDEDEQRNQLNAYQNRRNDWKKLDVGFVIKDFTQNAGPFMKYLATWSPNTLDNSELYRVITWTKELTCKFCDESDNEYSYDQTLSRRRANNNNISHRYFVRDRNIEEHFDNHGAISGQLEEYHWENLLFTLYEFHKILEEGNIDMHPLLNGILKTEVDSLCELFGKFILKDGSNINQLFADIKEMDEKENLKENTFCKRKTNEVMEELRKMLEDQKITKKAYKNKIYNDDKIMIKDEMIRIPSKNDYRENNELKKNYFIPRMEIIMSYFYNMSGISLDKANEILRINQKKERPFEVNFHSYYRTELSLYFIYLSVALAYKAKK